MMSLTGVAAANKTRIRCQPPPRWCRPTRADVDVPDLTFGVLVQSQIPHGSVITLLPSRWPETPVRHSRTTDALTQGAGFEITDKIGDRTSPLP